MPMMQGDKGEEGLQAGLLEEYILGICSPSEKEHIEKLAAGNKNIASTIDRMRKAMHCYCSSCHSEKIKSIRGSKIPHKETVAGTATAQSKLFKLPCAERHSSLINAIGSTVKRFKNIGARIRRRLGLD